MISVIPLLMVALLSVQGYAQTDDDFQIDEEMSEEWDTPAEPPSPLAAPATAPEKKITVKSTTVKPSSNNSESYREGQSVPRFDWSKHRNQEKVRHPLAEKGLIRITKDKTYVYGVESSPQNRAAGFRFGVFNPVNLENPETSGQAFSTFEENYDNTQNPALLFDYEWQLLHFGIGKLGLKLGTGIYFAQGHGHFENGNVETPREQFTLLIFPNSLGAVARFQMWESQLLVPYVDGGLTAFTFSEIRDDDKGPKFGAALASYWAVGGQFNLSYFDSLTRIALDREYGINRIYLVGEYRYVLALSDKFDFTSDLINAGFLMEF